MIATMLKRLRYRLRDTGTLALLFKQAELQAKKLGEAPTAEHLLLAALDLPDGTARTVFAALGVERTALAAALQNRTERKGAKAQSLMKHLVKRSKQNGAVPLMGVHVLDVLQQTSFASLEPILQELKITANSLQQQVQQELAKHTA